MKYCVPNAEVIVSLALLRQILDLPSGYEIVGSAIQRGGREVSLMVHAPELTQPLSSTPLHLLTPIYRRVSTGETELQEMRITPSHER